MPLFGKILRILGRIELSIAFVTFCAAMLLVIAQVGVRQIGGSLWWAQEWAQLLVMYAYFLGISHLYQVRQMIVVEFCFSRLPRGWQVVFYVISQMAVVIFCAITLYSALRNMPMELRFPSFVIQVPRFYWTLPLMVASVSMIFSSLYFIIAVIQRVQKGDISNISNIELSTAFASTDQEY